MRSPDGQREATVLMNAVASGDTSGADRPSLSDVTEFVDQLCHAMPAGPMSSLEREDDRPA